MWSTLNSAEHLLHEARLHVGIRRWKATINHWMLWAADLPLMMHWRLYIYLGAYITRITNAEFGKAGQFYRWRVTLYVGMGRGSQNVCGATGGWGRKMWFFAYVIYWAPLSSSLEEALYKCSVWMNRCPLCQPARSASHWFGKLYPQSNA